MYNLLRNMGERRLRHDVARAPHPVPQARLVDHSRPRPRYPGQEHVAAVLGAKGRRGRGRDDLRAAVAPGADAAFNDTFFVTSILMLSVLVLPSQRGAHPLNRTPGTGTTEGEAC
jgi:hypothetical protein